MQDAKEEVRSRLNIEEVIGEYVRLSRAGRSMKGLSPFTGEKTPSFMVSPDKHVWYDFSASRGGDIFSFVMEMEGLDFPGALELLARKAGVDLSLYKRANKDLGQKKQRLLGLLLLATQYYQQTLPKNNHAMEYVFKTRSLNKKVVQDFQIGFAPNSQNAVVMFLEKKGYSPAEIKQAGMTNQRGGDLFRSRVMVPLADSSGQVIGFTGRFLGDDKKAPKYLNTPQTLLYDKSRHVFGLDKAKQTIRQSDQAVVVEGNLDVVSSHQAGVTNVVAAAGTALTQYHLKIIKRLTSRVCLAFDNDRAGLAATERAIVLAQELEIELKIIRLPAKDPDELIKQNPDLWIEAIKNASPVVDWVIEEYMDRYDITSASGKRQFTSASLVVIDKLKDPVEQEHYLALVAEKSHTSLAAVVEKFHSAQVSNQLAPLKKPSSKPQISLSKSSYVEDLVSLAAFDQSVRGLLIELEPDDIPDEKALALVEYFHQQPEADVTTTPKDLQSLETYVKIVLLRAEVRYASWSQLDRYDLAARLVRLIKNETKGRHKQQLTEQLRQSEIDGQEKLTQSLQQQLSDIIKEMAKSDKPS